MPAANNFLPEGVAPEAAGRELANMPTAAGLQADIVERGYTIEQVMRKGDWKSAQSGLRYVMAV